MLTMLIIKHSVKVNHEHDHTCRDCESLKEVIQEIQSSINEYSSKINDKEKEDDLRYEAGIAEVKIKEWKAHIMGGTETRTK